MARLWLESFSDSAKRMAPPPPFLALASRPDITSFAGGVPDAASFPTDAINRAYAEVLSEPVARAQALQYATSAGLPALRTWIAQYMGSRAMSCDIDNVIITSGAQQALDLVGKLFINPGDRVAVTAPTFFAALDTFNAYRPSYDCIPFGSSGLDLAAAQAALQKRPRFVYVIPDFQNPTGLSLSIDERTKLLDLCVAHGVPLVEDAAYEALRFNGAPLPSLKSIAEERGFGDYVIYINTFSKTIAPGLRVGWLAADVEVIRKLAGLKLSADVHTSVLNQMAVLGVARNGFSEHVQTVCALYSSRRDSMLSALSGHMPDSVTWTEPEGGLFIWLTLPDGFDASLTLTNAIEEYKVAYVPGSMSFANGLGKNTCRLSFATANAERIKQGIGRLAAHFDNLGIAKRDRSQRTEATSGAPYAS